MAHRRFLFILAVTATASAVLGGMPAVADAATAVYPREAAGSFYGPLTSGLTARLSQGADDPVIVILRGQGGQQPDQSAPAPEGPASQGALVSELQRVHATRIKRFSLVNSVAATVSPLEARRLAADPAVARVVPDATFTVPGPALPAPAPVTTAPVTTARAAGPARSTSPHLNDVPGACAPKGKSLLAPEGLSLTSTVSGNPRARTARSLGFTGAGVKVAYIADGLDPANVNFKRAHGKSAFADYKDFTGNGPGAPTTGGEAFLDANTIAGQGTHVYNLNGYSAQSYTGTTCDVRIEGVAPGASLVGLDVFSGDQNDTLVSTTSMFAQAINYAVETDKVNVINESFGGNNLPDTTQDVIRLFDEAAVKAGVVVSVSSGDAGPANTIGSPATDPDVISVGASTQFQALAQANIGGTRYFAPKGWLSDNISAFSSAGYDEAGGTVDMVAPGDLSWASCDASAKYSDCVNETGKPSDIEEAGGTSESAPFVSGAAALVIQAFRKTHGGRTPTPLQVKQILLSTVTDLGAPAQEQGAGLLDSYRAVQLAQSYGRPKRTGSTLLTSPGQLTEAAAGGTGKKWKVTVTNEGAKAQTVTLSSRALNQASTSSAGGSVTLSDSKSNQYTADSGKRVNYQTFRFRVPAGQARLGLSMAYAANPVTVSLPPSVVLFDPRGRVAANSEPQGVANYGSVEVRAPAAGVWTGVISGPTAAAGGYNGKVVWSEATQNYRSFGTISPTSLSLAPGQAKTITVSVTAPADPGDLAGSILLHSKGDGVTSIPVVVRSLIDVASGGHFTGDLTGGNGRGALGTGVYYQFTVPAGTKAVRAEINLRDNPGIGNLVGSYLVGPNGNVEGYGENTDQAGAQVGLTDRTLAATAVDPEAGRWTLIMAFAQPVAGTEVSDPYTGDVDFNPAGTIGPEKPLPHGTTLAPGKAVTVPVKIINESNAPQDYFLDPRLDTATTMTLAPVVPGPTTPLAAGSAKTSLPISATATTALYFVPSLTSSIAVRQTSTRPAMTDLATAFGGDPDVGIPGLSKGPLCGTSASAAYTPSGGTVTSGLWEPAPTECGPYAKAASAATATDTLTVTTPGFDPGVTVSTGDVQQLARGAAAGNAGLSGAVEVQPGASAIVTVTFRPAGQAGSVVNGTLYLDTLQNGVPVYGQLAGDVVTALPYSYKVG
ncbi:MAG TPA: S8 family serine peptidase [Trebonia sp.]